MDCKSKCASVIDCSLLQLVTMQVLLNFPFICVFWTIRGVQGVPMLGGQHYTVFSILLLTLEFIFK